MPDAEQNTNGDVNNNRAGNQNVNDNENNNQPEPITSVSRIPEVEEISSDTPIITQGASRMLNGNDTDDTSTSGLVVMEATSGTSVAMAAMDIAANSSISESNMADDDINSLLLDIPNNDLLFFNQSSPLHFNTRDLINYNNADE